MNGEGDGYGGFDARRWLRGEFVTDFEHYGSQFGGYGTDFPVGLSPNFALSLRNLLSGEGIPSVDILPGTGAAGPSDRPLTESEALAVARAALESRVIDPETDPYGTVAESASEAGPGVEDPWYEPDTPEIDWDWVYDQWVKQNTPEVPVAIDWGTIAGEVIGGIFDTPIGQAAGQVTQSMWPPGTQLPDIVTVNTKTGKVTKCRRRRRRRLLTASDLNDLAMLKTIVGGSALQAAVVKAVRR